MEIRINYSRELQSEIKKEIDYIKDEFELLFGKKRRFSQEDRKIASDLLNFLSKKIETPVCLEYLTHTLTYLEKRYPDLF